MAKNNIPKRDNWIFGSDKLLLKDKRMLIEFHFNSALSKTLKIFEYEGLPESIPQRELEKILQLCDFAYWLKKDDDLYVFFGGLGGQPNEYYQPTNFIVANPYLKFFKVVDVNKEGVLMWNDYVHRNVLYFMMRRYAELMAECDITLRFGLINDRILSVFFASNDTLKESVEAFIQDVEDGAKLGAIVGDDWKDEEGGLNVKEYRKANSQDLKVIMELQQYLKASFFNDIGLQANYNMKRESINDSEAGMNEESLKPFIDDMLQNRKDALEKVNKQFGTNITVKLSSSWIRRDKIAKDETQETPTEETPVEEKSNDEADGKDGNENE